MLNYIHLIVFRISLDWLVCNKMCYEIGENDHSCFGILGTGNYIYKL